MKKILLVLCLMLAATIVLAAVQTQNYTILTNLQLTDNPATSSTDEGNLLVGDGTPTQTVDGEDAYVEGTLEAAGIFFPYAGQKMLLVEDYLTTTAANAVTAAEMSGKLFTATSISDDPVTHDLPTAVVGMWGIFSDMDATAVADMILNPQNADQINGSTAGLSWTATGDAAFPESALIYARAAGQWVLIPLSGTWGEGS